MGCTTGRHILIPITLAGVQVFNLRGIMKYAQNNWNYLSGTAIVTLVTITSPGGPRLAFETWVAHDPPTLVKAIIVLH